jgi:CheY-like chemotaxis protein
LTQSQPQSWQILQDLKSAPAMQRLPVIYLTDYSETPPPSAGAPLTVTTPVKPREVVDTVRKAANQSKKILVADDDEWIRVMLETILKDEGYTVLLAKDGRETLERLRQEKPDMLLVDLAMPEMSGWEVIQNVYSDPALRSTRVVIITGQILSQDEIRLISQNTQGFLSKSEFRVEKILAEVRAVMQNTQ